MRTNKNTKNLGRMLAVRQDENGQKKIEFICNHISDIIFFVLVKTTTEVRRLLPRNFSVKEAAICVSHGWRIRVLHYLAY